MLTFSRLVAAVVLTAATGAVLPQAPASAAACTTTSGVTVVVDFHELGGGLRQVCDPGSGQDGGERFDDAGFDLDRVQRQPGFVCRVNGAPADDPCVNTPPSDAYWSLWWSDGESGSWTYATQGIDSLVVPDGGSIALSWKGSSESSPPGVAPGTPDDPPSSSPSPSSGSSPGGQHSGGSGSGSSSSTSGSGGTQPGSSSSSSPSASGSATQGASGSADSTADQGKRPKSKKKRKKNPDAASAAPDAVAPDDEPEEVPGQLAETSSDPSDDGLPGWVTPVGIAVLFAAAGATAAVRRRRGLARP